MSEPLVIVGNGMAAARLCDELAQRALGRYAIAVIGEEPQLAYNRVCCPRCSQAMCPANEIVLKPASLVARSRRDLALWRRGDRGRHDGAHGDARRRQDD